MRPAALVAIGTVVLLAVPLAGCASGTPAAAPLTNTGGAPDACLPPAWRLALARATVPVPGPAEPLAVVPDGRVVVRVAGRPGLSLADADGSLQALAVPDAGPHTSLVARTDGAGRLVVTYRPDAPIAVATTSAPPGTTEPATTGPAATPRPADDPAASDAVIVDLTTGLARHVDPTTVADAEIEAVPGEVARQLEQRVGAVTVDAIAGTFVFFHPLDTSDAIELLDTRSGSIASTGLRSTGVAGSGYGVAYFGGALASTGGPASLRIIDTLDLPRIEC